MPRHAFHLTMPADHRSSVIFASPHSSRDYPADFLRATVLDEHQIRSSEDALVDQLFDCAPGFGAPLLCAGAPRAYVDLNRSEDELDPALFAGVPRNAHNPRVASGLGVIPRVVANGRAIYRGKLPLAEAHHRIEQHWRPYHAELQRLLRLAHDRFGEAILIDCHSMPHEALENLHRLGARRPDVVLGDRFGASAEGEVVDRIEAAFLKAGLRVVRNSPFAGAYVAQHYGRPSRRQHVVQVEIDRAIYLNEQAIRPNGNFAAFRKVLRSVVADLCEIGQSERDLPLAAE